LCCDAQGIGYNPPRIEKIGPGGRAPPACRPHHQFEPLQQASLHLRCESQPMAQDPFSTVVPFEVPGSIREFAEKGVSQARETYEKFKDVAQHSNETIEAVYAASTKGAADYSGKLIDIARANANSAFDMAEKLVAVKSPSEIFSIWT